MKNKIIEQSIENLKKDGLKFSVDSLAAQLGISKKTVYKYFPIKNRLRSPFLKNTMQTHAKRLWK